MNILIKSIIFASVSVYLSGCTHHGGIKKSSLYAVMAEVNVLPGHQQTATAQCGDANDVILTGKCQAPVREVNFRAFGESNSTYNSQPTSKSGWACTAFNPTDKTILNRAHATCVDVSEE